MIGEIRQNLTEASASVGLILTALATAKKPFSKLRATTDIFPSVAVHTTLQATTSQMQQRRYRNIS